MSSLPEGDPHLRVVILAGGIGSRFWPASLPSRPKPLLALGGSDRPLLVETVERALALAPVEHTAILAGESLAAHFLSALPGFPSEQLWIEPRARGTAPVLAWAAHRIHRADPKGVMVSLHSDHVVFPEATFLSDVRAGASLAAREDLLLTIAATPDRPETGYGYLRPGAPLASTAGEPEAFRLDAFVEKPDEATARDYLTRGYLWNTGIFIFPVARFLEEIRLHAPEIGDRLELLDGNEEGRFFDEVPSISVDEAVMERSGRVGALRATFSWDDVGGWEALTRTVALDPLGNAFHGDVHALDTRRTVAWAEDGPIVLFGVEGLVVVRSGGVTLVTSRERAPRLKELLAELPAGLRERAAGGEG
jgi:mannose-1-phosphate guanylyltransferase/mannose-6-phosphate isomerase